MSETEFGIREIAREMICQALKDVKGVYRQQAACRKEALAWFRDRSERPFGYGWCLYYSGLNPKTLREQITKFSNPKIKGV